MSTTWFKLTLLLLLVGTCFAASPPVEYNQPPTFAFIGGRFVVISHPQVTNPSHGGSGSVTHTLGNLTAGKCVIGNGVADITVDPICTLDGSGNLTVNSVTTVGTGPSRFTAQADPGVPLSGYFYFGSDGAFHYDDGSAVKQTFALNPMTTAGDIITAGASGVPTRLAMGTALQVLRVNAGQTALEFAAASGSSPTFHSYTPAQAGAISNGTDEIFATAQVPANALSTNKCVMVKVGVIKSNTNVSHTYKIYFGSTGTVGQTASGGTGITFAASPGIGNSIVLTSNVEICNKSATNSQQMQVSYVNYSITPELPKTAAIDTTAAQNVQLTINGNTETSTVEWFDVLVP